MSGNAKAQEEERKDPSRFNLPARSLRILRIAGLAFAIGGAATFMFINSPVFVFPLIFLTVLLYKEKSLFGSFYLFVLAASYVIYGLPAVAYTFVHYSTMNGLDDLFDLELLLLAPALAHQLWMLRKRTHG